MKTIQYTKTSAVTISKLFVTAILFVTAAFYSVSLQAQTSYKALPSASAIKVSGSSNLHDWTMNAAQVTSDAGFTFQGNQLTGLNGLNFSMPVKNLKSNEDLMDTRAYKALKADKSNTITFRLTSATVTPLQNNHYQIRANGKLQIAGVTRDIALAANAVINADQSISCTGYQKVKMSDFGIQPPTFMLGALKVADEVNVGFNLKFKN